MMPPRIPQLHGPAAAAFAAHLLDEKKADAITVLDVRGLCGFTDFFVLATVESGLQLRGLAETLRRGFKQVGQPVLADPVVARTSWVVVDAADVVVHLFTSEARLYYNLERLWGDASSPAWDTLEGSDEARAASRRFLSGKTAASATAE